MNNSTPQFATWDAAVRWLRAQPDQQALVRAAYYDDPLIEAAHRYWRSGEWKAVRRLLPESGEVLDVGAGRGIGSYALARDGFSVTALEPEPGELVGAHAIRTLAAEASLPITVVEELSERLPFQDATFDVVFARAALHHIRDLDAACREFARVLRPGGRLVAIREHVISRQEDRQAFLNAHPLHYLYGGENAFLLGEYISAIQKAGFRVSRVIAPFESEINFAPYTLASLQSELVGRIAHRFPGGVRLISAMLMLPGGWRIVRTLLSFVDNRPGRLFSFQATKV